jgi:hypothetical protein
MGNGRVLLEQDNRAILLQRKLNLRNEGKLVKVRDGSNQLVVFGQPLIA